jgi:hypothetical protein
VAESAARRRYSAASARDQRRGVRFLELRRVARALQTAWIPLGAARAGARNYGGNVANVKESLSKILEIDGAVGACVVDSNSGMMLGAEGGGSVVNLEVAAAGNTEVVRAKRKTMRALNISDTIDDILITLGKQYHLIRPLRTNDALFIYLVLDKNKSNLAMARHQLTAIESTLSI